MVLPFGTCVLMCHRILGLLIHTKSRITAFILVAAVRATPVIKKDDEETVGVQTVDLDLIFTPGGPLAGEPARWP